MKWLLFLWGDIIPINMYVSNRKALVFPVMCNGHIKIPEVSGEGFGLFGHEGSFTIETIITPYDVNGWGFDFELQSSGIASPVGDAGVLSSRRTMPSNCDDTPNDFEDFLYSPSHGGTGTIQVGGVELRYLQEMTLFYNGNVSLSLVNNTNHNTNQPAEYQVKFQVHNNGTTKSITSDSVITADHTHTGTKTTRAYATTDYNENVYEGDNKIRYRKAGTTVNGATSSAANFTATTQYRVYKGQRLYTLSGTTFTSIGTVTGISGTTITMSQSNSLSNGAVLYTDAYKEAFYMFNSFHIAAVYNDMTKVMTLYVNGKKVKRDVINVSGVFSFQQADSYIGQVPVSGLGNLNNTIGPTGYQFGTPTQFMGELHEFAILNDSKEHFDVVDTLAPSIRSVLLYYRFEEANL